MKKTVGGYYLRFLPIVFFLLAACAHRPSGNGPAAVLRIYDWKTGEVYGEFPTKTGDRFFFGWVHSLEKFEWKEYYHVESDGKTFYLILDAITFPAFGAGVPENKGAVTYIKDGLIHMEQIEQKFVELSWLNSHFATRDLILENELIARGSSLPEHTRLLLIIERR
jgi:hypothetical protein